ncbi:MAG: hypothetical protein JSW17_01800 [Candidatus Omnitrophota bacterium]|nr:MAG: hypothetical protein JSW17_01800 [Candidatus Omnitrophota bacterium]
MIWSYLYDVFTKKRPAEFFPVAVAGGVIVIFASLRMRYPLEMLVDVIWITTGLTFLYGVVFTMANSFSLNYATYKASAGR